MTPGIVYLRHDDNDHDHTVVTVYTYLKCNPEYSDNIYIIRENDIESQTVDVLNQIYNKLIYISPGLECKQMILSNKNCTDITGRVFQDLSFSPSDTSTNTKKIAIVCYVYYIEYYQNIYNHVNKLSQSIGPIDLYIYLCDTNSVDHAATIIENQSPGSQVNIMLNWVENKGRDVRSFLMFINSNNHTKYDFICKLHTKKTTYLHDQWREVFLTRLLGLDDFESHVATLTEKTSGISSVNKFEIQEKHVVTNNNYDQLKHLSNKLDMNIKHMHRYKFIAGTMFWCTKAYCDNIKKSVDLNEQIISFPNEPIMSDGTLAHAWERAFWLI